MNTVSAIEQVLSRGSKSTTYKLAVLRAIIDFVIEHPAREAQNGFHRIPVVEIARRVLTYYWRLALDGIPQGSQAKIPRRIGELATIKTAHTGIDLTDPKAGLALGMLIEGAEQIDARIVDALLDVRHVLLDQPLRYLPNVGRHGQRVTVFSLITLPDERGHGPGFDADYEAHRLAAPTKRELRGAAWTNILLRERTMIVLSARSFEEISDVRFWVRDAIILRWAQECERFAKGEGGSISVPAGAFELSVPERDSARIVEVKSLYRELGVSRCMYSDRALPDGGVLDHVLPWSRFPVNLFWNLVPCHPEVNAKKSDGLPELTSELRNRFQVFLTRCVSAGKPLVERDVAATFRRYYQRDTSRAASPNETAQELWSVIENSHAHLASVGVDLWQG